VAKPIQNPRVGQALAREFNLVGRVNPLLDEVLVPVVLSGDIRSTVPPRRREATARNSISPGVGLFAFFRFEVPPATLARVTHLFMDVEADTLISFHWGSSLAAPVNAQTSVAFTDGRLRREGALPAGRFFVDDVAAPLISANRDWEAFVLAASDGRVFLPESTVGQPDNTDFLEITLRTADVDANATIYWEEFPYQASLAG